VSKYFGVALNCTFQTHYTLMFDMSYSYISYLHMLFHVTVTMWLMMQSIIFLFSGYLQVSCW
jgi:hypothetical protein